MGYLLAAQGKFALWWTEAINMSEKALHIQCVSNTAYPFADTIAKFLCDVMKSQR